MVDESLVVFVAGFHDRVPVVGDDMRGTETQTLISFNFEDG